MVADTIMVVLVCFMPTQQPKEVKKNRFTESFEQADKEFDKEFKLDIEALKKAAHEAAISADEKTKVEKERALRPLINVKELFP